MKVRKFILAAATAAVILCGCETMMSMVSQKNFLGRYYIGALNERKFAQLTAAMDKLYSRRVQETQRKKPHIFGQCVLLEVEKALPDRSYSSYGDWKNTVTSDDVMKVATFGGRTIYISQGLLDKAGYQQDLVAYMVAHAMAHDLLGHTNERLHKEDPPEGVGDILEAWVADIADFQAFAMGLNGSPLTRDGVRPYSVEMEDEADTVAINILAYGGFNPNNAVALLSQQIGHGADEYLRIHPMTQERFDKIAASLENVAALRAKAVQRSHVPDCENFR